MIINEKKERLRGTNIYIKREREKRREETHIDARV
jgi:hypothetical protein